LVEKQNAFGTGLERVQILLCGKRQKSLSSDRLNTRLGANLGGQSCAGLLGSVTGLNRLHLLKAKEPPPIEFDAFLGFHAWPFTPAFTPNFTPIAALAADLPAPLCEVFTCLKPISLLQSNSMRLFVDFIIGFSIIRRNIVKRAFDNQH